MTKKASVPQTFDSRCLAMLGYAHVLNCESVGRSLLTLCANFSTKKITVVCHQIDTQRQVAFTIDVAEFPDMPEGFSLGDFRYAVAEARRLLDDPEAVRLLEAGAVIESFFTAMPPDNGTGGAAN